MRNNNTFTIVFFFLAVTGVIAGLFWANLAYVQKSPGGPEFIVPWKATQNFILEGTSPYDKETLSAIQKLIYGHQAKAGDHPYRVNVPLFFLVFFIPLSLIRDLAVARAIWLVVLEASLLMSVFFALRLMNWKPHWAVGLGLGLFFIFWQPSSAMIVSSTSSVIQIFIMLSALRCLEVGSDELAGFLIAITLVNLEMTGFVFITLLVWVFSTQRWRVLAGILMTLVLLVMLSILLLPGWMYPFLLETLRNWIIGFIPSTYVLFERWMPGIGQRIAQIISVAALTLLLFTWTSLRGRDIRSLFWSVCFTSAIVPLLGVPYFPYWLVYTTPAVVLIVSGMIQRWKLIGYISSAVFLLVVFGVLWLAQIRGYSSIFIMFYPILLVMLLYWMRWAVVRPPRMWADEIALRG